MPPLKFNASDSEWAKIFQEELATKSKKPEGPGWKTSKELAKLWGCNIDTATKYLVSLLNQKKAVRFDGSQLSSRGVLYHCVWYKLTR